MFFSVIVPIYNIEKYIKRCVESVLAQSFTDFELILVDDGSPDNCPAICDAFSEADERIKVIHKQNGGLVSARQAGISIASGEYVFNLDGDDAICPDALESAYQIIQETQADVVSFSYRRYEHGVISKEVVEDLATEGLYNKAQMREQLYPKLLSDKNMQHLFYYVWGKALKRDLVLKHQLGVNPIISLGEDLCCMIPCYVEAQTVYMSKKAIYLYTIRDDSLTTDFKTGQITQIANVILELRKMTGDLPEDFQHQISRYSCYMCLAILATAAQGNHFRAAAKIKELIQTSVHREEIQKAHFEKLTIKSRIAIYLIKKEQIRLAFHFLHLCERIKRIRRSGRA